MGRRILRWKVGRKNRRWGGRRLRWKVGVTTCSCCGSTWRLEAWLLPPPPHLQHRYKVQFQRTNRFIFLCWEVCKNHEPFLSFLLCLIGHHVPEGVVHLFGDPEVGGESDGDLGLLRLQEYKGAVNIRGP